MANLPENVIPESATRDDSGRRVIVNSVGGPSWPDNRTGKKVIENWNGDTIGQYAKTDKKKRALENVQGTVVWGPYKLYYMAHCKATDKNGNYIKKGGKYVLTRNKQKFITEPYWNVLLDGYNREVLFCEKELTFVD